MSPEEKETRLRIVAVAQAELGNHDPLKYWMACLEEPPTVPLHNVAWCGVFALWALKQAKLFPNVYWKFGKGFLWQLPQIKEPQFGDIAYFSRFQHHAVVGGLDDTHLALINGNGLGGAVTISMVLKNAPTTFFQVTP